MPNPKKIKMLEEVKEELKEIDGLVLANYKGLTVADFNDLRRKVKENNGNTKVIKNNILKLALKENAIEGLDDFLKENTVVFYSKEDIIAVLKVISAFSKENDKLMLKGGYVSGKVADAEEIKQISQLPSRKELLGMVIGGMNSVVSSFVGVLNSMITSLVGTIEAIEDKKKKEDS